MADRRRRRRPATSESEFSETDDSRFRKNYSTDRKRGSDCESEGEQAVSEYESATEENEDDYTYTEEYTDDDSSVLIEDEYIEDDWVSEERQSGDGQEQPDETGSELDDDEDRKNPAFVPRKGNFYEHDTRQGEEGSNEQQANVNAEQSMSPSDLAAKERRERKMKLWEEATRWDHDRYDQNQQAPKSREELIAEYGYDIRAHDKPPDAPPRRGNSRGRRSENRPRFGDYMAGRFENPRTPKYGPKAMERNQTGSRGRGVRGTGNQSSMRGRGRPQRESPRNDYNNYSKYKMDNVDNTHAQQREWDDSPKPNNNNSYKNRGNRQNNQYEDNRNEEWPEVGGGIGRSGNNRNKDQQYNQQSRTFTRKSPQRGYNNQQYLSNEKVSTSNKSRSEESENYQDSFQGNSNNTNVEKKRSPRQRTSVDRPTNVTDKTVSSEFEQANLSHRVTKGQKEKMNKNRRRSRSPPEVKAEKTTGASFENVLDIAPPLTTIETRTLSTVGSSAGGDGDHVAKKPLYSQDVRKNLSKSRKGEGDQLEMPKKKFEQTDKPPRFREKEQQQNNASNVTSVSYQPPPPPASSQQLNPMLQTTKSEQLTRAPTQTKRYSSQRQRNVAEIDNITPPTPIQMQTPAPAVINAQTVSVAHVQQPVTSTNMPPANLPNQPRLQIPMQVSTPPVIVAAGNAVVSVPMTMTGPLPAPRAPALPVTMATAGPPPQMQAQYFVAQQTGQVFRQAAPVYGPAGVNDPKSSGQYPTHILQQQQAIAIQGPSQRVSQATVGAASHIVYAAQPQPTAHVLAPGTGSAPRMIQASPSQYIGATPLVNMSTAPQIQHGSQPQQPQQQHYQIAPTAPIQASNQLQAVAGQLPVQFAVPPPAVHQRGEASVSTSANTNVGGSANLHMQPNTPPAQQGQTVAPLPSTVQGQGAAQSPVQGTSQQQLTAAQLPAQVVSPPGPGQPPAIHVRGGTTYFNPQIQMYGVSPVRRTKEPIPIVSPQGTPDRPGSSEGDLDHSSYYEANEDFLYEEQPYVPIPESELQHQNSPDVGGQLAETASPAYKEHAAQQESPIQEQQQAAPTSPSSFENLLKQSGSIDNIKEFKPTQQQVDGGAMSPSLVEQHESDQVADKVSPLSPGQSFTEDDDEETKRLIYVVDSSKDLLSGYYHDNVYPDGEENEDDTEDFHVSEDDQSDESDIDFEEGIIASTEQTLSNSRNQSLTLSPSRETVPESAAQNSDIVSKQVDQSTTKEDAEGLSQIQESRTEIREATDNTVETKVSDTQEETKDYGEAPHVDEGSSPSSTAATEKSPSESFEDTYVEHSKNQNLGSNVSSEDSDSEQFYEAEAESKGPKTLEEKVSVVSTIKDTSVKSEQCEEVNVDNGYVEQSNMVEKFKAEGENESDSSEKLANMDENLTVVETTNELVDIVTTNENLEGNTQEDLKESKWVENKTE